MYQFYIGQGFAATLIAACPTYCVCVCVCVCERERVCVCVCVCVKREW